MARCLGVLLLVPCLAFSLFAQGGENARDRPTRYAMTLYGVEDGLPDPVVSVVRQTRDGYLWIGTDHGLARFDGVEFKTYRAAHTPGLGHDMIRCLFEDAEGTLWIGTQNGLSLYKAGKFEQLLSLDTPVTAVLVDRTGRRWIGTRGRGLYEYADRILRDCNSESRDSGRLYIRALFEDSTGRIWAGLPAGAPAYIEGGRLKRLELPIPSFGTAAFAEEPRGTLWFTSGASVIKWRDGVFVEYGKNRGLGDEEITGLCVDASRQVWAVSRKHLSFLQKSDDASFVDVPIATLNQSRHITIDREGNYWIATSGFGLAKLRTSAFENVDLPPGDSPVATISIDRDGTVSLGLTPEGVVRIAPDGTRRRIDTGPGPANEVLSVSSTRDHRLWIGRRSTLLVWHEGQLVEYAEARGIRAIHEDNQGRVWLGSNNGGVIRYQDGKFENVTSALGLPPRSIVGAFAESDGALFVGLLSGGLIEVREGVVKRYDSETGAPLDMIRALKPDRDGLLWIGLRGNGLALFHAGRVWNPPALSVPFQGLVSAVELDDAGHLFVGSSRGILWASRESVLAVARGERADSPFQRAAESEGLKPAIVGFGLLPASGKGSDGRLWFATRAGVVAVDPTRLVSNPVPPQVHILRASIADRTAEIVNQALVIPPDGAAVRIDYTATCFARPDLVQFRYRLDNHDPGWTEAGTRRSALFSNLPPGKHRFRVIAANESGVWSQDGATLTIVQEPHFYQTLWFRILVFSAFTALIAIVARWWTRRNLQRHLDALEAERRLQRERTRIARDLHDEIGVGVTKIGYLVDRLELSSTPASAKQLQEQLSRQTRMLASDLDRVVWSVSPATATLPRLANFIATFAQTFLRETPVRCSTRFPAALPDLPITPELQHHVLAVAKEAINNALKHASPTHIELHMSFDGQNFMVSIRDDGCGFTVNDHAHSERNGLSNMRARLAEVGGKLTIDSTRGSGTTVSLHLPLPPVRNPAAAAR